MFGRSEFYYRPCPNRGRWIIGNKVRTN
jgi:hypothetical protein